MSTSQCIQPDWEYEIDQVDLGDAKALRAALRHAPANHPVTIDLMAHVELLEAGNAHYWPWSPAMQQAPSFSLVA